MAWFTAASRRAVVGPTVQFTPCGAVQPVVGLGCGVGVGTGTGVGGGVGTGSGVQ